MILSFPAAKMVTDEQTDGANQYAPSTSTTWGSIGMKHICIYKMDNVFPVIWSPSENKTINSVCLF